MIPHMLLRELEVPFTAVKMGLGPDGYEAADGSFTHAGYLKINPNGYVPTLSVDGFIITEMPAILRYVASLAPQRRLLGSTLLEQARVEEWMVWLSGTLHSTGFGAFWRPMRFVDDGEHMHAAIVDKGRKTILRCYGRIESKIEGKYAVGEHLTTVDFCLHTFWRWGSQVGFDMQNYPRYRGLVREVEQLEAVKAAMAEEGEPLLFTSS